jgi:MarR family transcriptional regulator, organic hydroperoxide resistance regulator
MKQTTSLDASPAGDAGGDRPAPPVYERVSFAIHQLGAQMARICNPLFRKYGVDVLTTRILVLVLERETMAIGDMVKLLRLPQSTISHQVKRLEGMRYLARTRDQQDRRVVSVMLTATGRLVAEACNALSIEVYRTMVGDMPVEQVEAVRADLAAMLARLEHTDPIAIQPLAPAGSGSRILPLRSKTGETSNPENER